MNQHCEAGRIEVNGIVQGVGFRPFVYSLARRHGLAGEVSNTSAGVAIVVEGPAAAIEAFAADLVNDPPPLAHIVEVLRQAVPVAGYLQFTIALSSAAASRSTLISPDVSICEDCRRELFDPGDRRYRYPFINCTNCGPRYTIIDDIPYDRPRTSMKHFEMCPQCQKEYDDPSNRRFHAQPNACPVCGPRVSLFDRHRNRFTGVDPIHETAHRLRNGRIVAIKGLGGFHLAVDAENQAAVRRLRSRKRREEKPFALMAPSVAGVRQFARCDAAEEKLLTGIQRPIVLLHKREPNPIAADVAPGNRYFGVMLPYTPLHYLLLDQGFTALVMTSGNMSEEPIAIDNEEAFRRLDALTDDFLVHDREIYLRSDDSIVRRAAGETRLIRRSRGYVPVPIFLRQKVPAVLACGAELKNTICLTRGDQAFVSQHIGDLENAASEEFFRFTIGHMRRILEIEPEILAYDLHPDYLSTRWALEQERVRKVPVQHHHAHIVSAMAENRIDGPVIGLAFDGTGYGSDGAVWGGEVLVADERKFDRAAHLAYVPLPGSTAAIRQPWRMGLSYLHAAFGKEVENLTLPFLAGIDGARAATIGAMIQKRINSPPTSSLGRLFDGVAAIIGLRSEVAFEGQAAMELEMMAAAVADQPYDFSWRPGAVGAPLQIESAPIIRGVVEDLQRGTAVAVISARFHFTLMRLFTELCDQLRRETGLVRVVLSGGVFQNAVLLNGLIRNLEDRNLKVYTHKQVPTNDGGLSLGQAVIAAAQAGM
ncbi:MAG: carbamoyltransferase HypF [Desulfobacterales bacterium]